MLARSLAHGCKRCAARSLATSAAWADVPMGPPDPIFSLTEKFLADTDENKISVGVGAYRDDNGKPYILPSVMEAEKRILDAQTNHEYATIAGVNDFTRLALEFAYGSDSTALADGRVAGTQTISGTGALRLAGEYYRRFLGEGTPIYLPNPSWGNHTPIYRESGLDVRTYRYYDADKSKGEVDFAGLVEDVRAAPKNSVFLWHACAHNPTGIDLTMEQWGELSDEVKKAGVLSLFDCAYQGFATGNAEQDAAAIRLFVDEGHPILLCQSFAKNFGLYGERIGALSAVCADPDEAARVFSQLKIIIRPMYSNPPIHGAHIVATVLADPALRAQWDSECKGMADRIIEMRQLLKSNLEKAGSTLDWSHIESQIGMFCYSGLTKEQVDTLQTDHHVYMTGDGRISMAGVTSANVEYLSNAMHAVTK